MGSAQIVASAILQNSTGAVRTTVAGDPDAIGYVSLGSMDSTVKAVSVDGVTASATTVKNGTYPVVRPFLFLTKSQPAGLVKAFLDWVVSQEGQAVVAKEYVTIS